MEGHPELSCLSHGLISIFENGTISIFKLAFFKTKKSMSHDMDFDNFREVTGTVSDQLSNGALHLAAVFTWAPAGRFFENATEVVRVAVTCEVADFLHAQG